MSDDEIAGLKILASDMNAMNDFFESLMESKGHDENTQYVMLKAMVSLFLVTMMLSNGEDFDDISDTILSVIPHALMQVERNQGAVH